MVAGKQRVICDKCGLSASGAKAVICPENRRIQLLTKKK